MENQEEEQVEGFGKASLGSKREGPQFLKLKAPDPRNPNAISEYIGRLLPPMLSLADDEYGWRRYVRKHFGHNGHNPRNPEKPRFRPFKCIEVKNFREKTIEVHCPKCDQIEVYKGKQAKREREILEANPEVNKIENENERKAAARELFKEDAKHKAIYNWLFKHSCENLWWMNTKSLKGEYVTFGVTHSFMKDVLEPKLAEWKAKLGLNPFSLKKAPFLKFTRSGTKPRVVDAVELYKEPVKVEGEILEKTKLDAMSSEDVQRALKECCDLGATSPPRCIVPSLTSQQIEKLIEAGDDPHAVDAVWGDTKSTTSSNVKAGQDDDEEKVDLSGGTKTEEKVETKATPDLDDEEAKLEAQMAAIREKKAAAKAKATAPVPKMAEEKSMEDFLADFEA